MTPALQMILTAAAVTYGCRALGILWAGRLQEGDPGFRLASCIAYALLAALVVKLVALPGNPGMAATPIDARVLGIGTTAFVLLGLKRNVLFATWAGVGVFGLGSWVGLT